MRRLCAVVFTLIAVGCSRNEPAGLPIGTAAPEFSLPGIDGKSHALRDYAGSRALAVVFTGNSCPASQEHEARIRKLQRTIAAGDSLGGGDQPECAVGHPVGDLGLFGRRLVARRHEGPAANGGSTILLVGCRQSVAKKFGVVSAPHIFVFDQARMLRYQGRIGGRAAGPGNAGAGDARTALDAVLAGQTVATARTAVEGLSLKGLAKPAWRRPPMSMPRSRWRWRPPRISGSCARTAPASCS